MARLTDGQISRHAIPAACRLICAVRAGDQREVSAAFGALQVDLGTDPATAARALAVVLAAACPDDRSMGQLLAWRQEEYRRLVAAGVNPNTAADLAAQHREAS